MTLEVWKVGRCHEAKYCETIFKVRQPFLIIMEEIIWTWSPEDCTLWILVGDGGYAYDPFNLAQQDCEFLGKIYSIDVHKIPTYQDCAAPIISRIEDIPDEQRCHITRIAKGVCNGGSIIFEKDCDCYIKYVSLIDEDNIESAVAFIEPCKTLAGDHGKVVNQP